MTSGDRLARARYGGYHRGGSQTHADDVFSRVGPGTPCGEYYRRFWLPVGLVCELTDVPLRVRILAEDLVLFRDRSGDLGLLELACLHRGTSLEFGKIAEHGIKCCYHGWHYAVDGTILETPTHGDDTTLKERAYQGAYPVHEFEGIVFAYLGPPEAAPAFPVYDVHAQPGITHQVDKHHSPCNWLQVRENGMDPVHSVFLHADHDFPQTLTDFPVMTFKETPIGIVSLTCRRIGEMVYLRHNEIFLPTVDWVNGLEDACGETVFDRRGGMVDWVVPIDDANSVTFKMYDVYDFDGQLKTGMDGLWDRDPSVAGGFSNSAAQAASGQAGDRPYLERQRSPGDWDAWTSQGTMHDRESENLGLTDLGVVTLRNLVHRGIDAVARGEDPVGIVRDGGAPIRTHAHNTVVRVPVAATPDQDRRRLDAVQNAFFDAIAEGALHQDIPGAERLKIGREIVRNVVVA